MIFVRATSLLLLLYLSAGVGVPGTHNLIPSLINQQKLANDQAK